MGSNESVLIPMDNTTITKSRASAKTTNTIVEASTDYERKVLESMVSNHFEQISVASEYCYTINTITSTGNGIKMNDSKSKPATRASVSSVISRAPRRGNNPSGGGGGY